MNRDRMIDALEDGPWDVIVVGGGASGLGIAVDAQSRGYRTLLLEKWDFAKATSSRSTKLVHGGVRYLEYGQFLLVRESARERKVLRHIAPHLVHPIPFIYPVFGGDRLWLIRAGLALFDRMASATAEERSRRLDPDAVRRSLPGRGRGWPRGRRAGRPRARSPS